MQRYLFPLLFLLCVLPAARGQLVYTPQTIVVDNVKPGDFEGIGRAMLYNTGNDTVTVRWTREIVFLSPGWNTAGCDRNFCYEPTISSATVLLPRRDSTILNVYVYPNGRAGEAEIRMKVVPINRSGTAIGDTLRATYYFNRSVSGTRELALPALPIAPNPVGEEVQINPPADAQTLLIYGANGQLLRQLPLTSAPIYVGDLPPAIYYLEVRDRQRQPLARGRMVKG